MKVTVLVENSRVENCDLLTQHGLSLYIETNHHRILFDVGANEMFALNAKALHVDLSKVDILVLSHGHYDHGGGLQTFLSLNQNAKIYVHKEAFIDHYFHADSHHFLPIGLAKNLMVDSRFVLIDHDYVIDDELTLISAIDNHDYMPSGNDDLWMEKNHQKSKDDFHHEQNLLIHEEQNHVLITGCSHRGVVNILRQVIASHHVTPRFLIGGFHLYNPGKNISEPHEFVEQVAQVLHQYPTIYYTGHCTGIQAYEWMKPVLKDQLNYAATGMKIELD